MSFDGSRKGTVARTWKTTEKDRFKFLMTTFAFRSTCCYLLYELTFLFDNRTVPGVSEGNHDTLYINIILIM